MKRPVLLALIAAIIVVPAVAGVLIHALTSGSSASPVASGPSPGAYRGSEPPAGIRLPAFALRDYRGDVVRTSALRGKVVLVTFLDTDAACARSRSTRSPCTVACKAPAAQR